MQCFYIHKKLKIKKLNVIFRFNLQYFIEYKQKLLTKFELLTLSFKVSTSFFYFTLVYTFYYVYLMCND